MPQLAVVVVPDCDAGILRLDQFRLVHYGVVEVPVVAVLTENLAVIKITSGHD